MKPTKGDLIKSITMCARSYDEDLIKKRGHKYIHAKSSKPWYKPWKWYNEFCYFVEEGDTTHMVIRGTEGIGAWIDNMDMSPVDGGIYDGFHDGAGRLWNIIEYYFGEKRFKGLVIHGHSRGSSIAMVIAYWFADLCYWMDIPCPVKGVFCWDGPRTGTQEFKDNYNSYKNLKENTWFICMKNSLVTNLPPKRYFGKTFVRTPENIIVLDNKKNNPLDSVLNHSPKEILKTLLRTNI